MFFKKKLKKSEIIAINNKIAYPEAIVVCPRCGGKLKYYAVGNIAEVDCTSKGCIRGNSRGDYSNQSD